MTTQPERCCGTCRWWSAKRTIEQQSLSALPCVGYCNYPVPHDLSDSFSRTLMKSKEGTDCPCHEPKEKEPNA